MVSLYRWLLYLYPAAYRCEYGEEMIGVYCEAKEERDNATALRRVAFFLREIAGLLRGALQERWWSMVGSDFSTQFATGRITMRPGFRFPKSAPLLMTIILAGIGLALEKARAIEAAVDGHAEPSLLKGVAIIFAAAMAAAALVWSVLFLLRRSGAHRLAEIAAQRSPYEIKN